MATTLISGVQYSGIWNLNSQAGAQAASTWPSQPMPYLYSWGYNNFGQLGLANTGIYYSSPTQVGVLTSWLKISSGSYNTYSVKTDGTAWAWGYGEWGCLGLGNATYYSSPKQIGALTNWSTVKGGFYNGLAIKTDETLWSWGRSNLGQLGLGNTTAYSSPKQIGSSATWSTPESGRFSSFALG